MKSIKNKKTLVRRIYLGGRYCYGLKKLEQNPFSQVDHPDAWEAWRDGWLDQQKKMENWRLTHADLVDTI